MADEEGGNKLSDEFIGYKTNDNSNWNRESSKDQRNTPLRPIQLPDGERVTSDKDDHDLPCYNNELNTYKEVIAGHALEDIEFVVQTSAVVLIKYLHPHERIED